LDLYSITISNNIREILEEDEDDQESYFKNPETLEDIFKTLEEKNLFKI
jgi:hypothetical protein